MVSFLLDRVKSSIKEEFDPRAVDALTQKLSHSPISSALSFIKVIDQHIKDPKYSLIESLNPYRRARNLTLNWANECLLDPKLFQFEAENNLYDAVQIKKEKLARLIDSQNNSQVLAELEGLASPLAVFFESVMVNDKDQKIKDNRLALLFQVRKLYEDIADFSLLQVYIHPTLDYEKKHGYEQGNAEYV